MQHIVHIVFRFDVGGLENGIVNILNRLPAHRYRHSLVCLTDYNPEFFRRIVAEDIDIYALHKRPGKDPAYLFRLWRLLRQLKPDIVHSRNLTTLECQAIAWLSGCAIRIHGEHGWDSESDKTSARPAKLRRLFKPLISHYIALSYEGEQYLQQQVGVDQQRISRICNGVDTERFHPTENSERPLRVIGTVGRLAPVKNQALLLHAIKRLCDEQPGRVAGLQVQIVGDGPSKDSLARLISELALQGICTLQGNRHDIPTAMQELDLYIQPSKAEGISNTILEAMASGLAIIATDVGGARELIEHSHQGVIVPNDDIAAMAKAIACYLDDEALAKRHGHAARQRTEQRFSLDTMATAYDHLYQQLTTAEYSNKAQG